MWLFIYIISTGNCLFLILKIYQTQPKPPKPFYISHVAFDFFWHPEICPNAPSPGLCRSCRRYWRRPRPLPPAAPGRSPRGRRAPRSAARCRRSRPSRPRRRAPSAAGAARRRGGRPRPPGRCRCCLGGRPPREGVRWKGHRGHMGDPTFVTGRLERE